MSESTRMMLGLAIGKKKEEWALAIQLESAPLWIICRQFALWKLPAYLSLLKTT